MRSARYVTAAYLAEKTGFSARWFTAGAAAGNIPGAHQPTGSGGAWRFDERAFWRWWQSRESKPKGGTWQASTGGGTSGGAAFGVKAVNSGSRLRQRLGL